jgi:outer membrane protein
VTDSLLAAGFTRSAMETATEDHFPEVKAALARVEAAQANELVVRNSKLPVLSLSSQMGSRTSSAREEGFNNQLRENFNQQIGLNLTIPIFNNNLSQINLNLAKLESEQAKVAHRQIRQQVRQRIMTAKLDFHAAYRKFQAAQTGYQALQEEFRFADKQLRLGLISAIAYGEVRSRYFAAQSQLWQDRYDCLFKWKILQYYQGEALY